MSAVSLKTCVYCQVRPARSDRALYCVECKTAIRKAGKLASAQKWRDENPEAKRAYDKLYYATNRDTVQARRKSRPDRTRRQRDLRRHAEKGDAINAYNRARYATDITVQTRKRIAARERQLGLERAELSEEERATIAILMARARTLGLHVDHIVPLAGCRGCGAKGTWELTNLQLLSPAENRAKYNRCQSCWNAT